MNEKHADLISVVLQSITVILLKQALYDAAMTHRSNTYQSVHCQFATLLMNPYLYRNLCSPIWVHVAQWLEHLTGHQKVTGCTHM